MLFKEGLPGCKGVQRSKMVLCRYSNIIYERSGGILPKNNFVFHKVALEECHDQFSIEENNWHHQT